MKRFLILLLCAAVFVLNSCSKDDDNPPIDTANLIGKWELYKDYDAYSDFWDYEYGEGIDFYQLEFRSGGVCIETDSDYYGNPRPSEELRYKLESTALYIYEENEDPYDAEKARIEKLTASELVLAYDYTKDGHKYTDKEYYKRIN